MSGSAWVFGWPSGPWVSLIVASRLSLATTAVPPWIWGVYFILFFAFALRLFPSAGYLSIPPSHDPWLRLADFLWHMTLPVLTMAFASFGAWAYVTRNLVLSTAKEDFVLAARARGVPEGVIMRRHVLRAASPPIITILAVSLITSLSWIILVEILFGLPGIGRLYWEALGYVVDQELGPVDVPLLVALPIVYAMLFLLMIFLLDLIYGLLDPRIRAFGRRET